MSKHTPGPWVCFFKNKYQEWHVGLPCSDNLNMNIALCPDGVPGGDLSESEANARLIAAAPELVQVLGELLDGEDYDGEDVLHVDADLFWRATAILRKAKGDTK